MPVARAVDDETNGRRQGTHLSYCRTAAKGRKSHSCTYLAWAPPARVAPVSPSPILGAIAEKGRVRMARVVVVRGRVTD